MSQATKDFIILIAPGAIATYIKDKVLPSLTLAQAILESDSGSSIPGNMVFGIKWTSGCGYDKQLLWTTEWINGKETRVQDWFRKYNSLADSIADHGNFLVVNSRYKPVLEATDYKSACIRIQACGYATDPNYATQLISIIEQYNLQQYDEQAIFEASVAKFPSKIISTPEYWLQNCIAGKTVNGSYMNAVILRFVACFKMVSTFEEACNAMKELGISNSPEYWIANALPEKTVQGDYARKLLVNMATKL